MNPRSIQLGALAATICAWLGVTILFWNPVGNLRWSQWWILSSSVFVGVVVCLAKGTRQPEISSRWNGFWPLACFFAVVAITAAAGVATRAVAAGLADQSSALLDRECQTLIRNWPKAPAPADFRRLEWSLHAGWHRICKFEEKRRELGLLDAFSGRLLAAALRRQALGPAAGRDEPIPARSSIPQGRETQYTLMNERIGAAARDLVESARATRLDPIIEWAERLERGVTRIGHPVTPGPTSMAAASWRTSK